MSERAVLIDRDGSIRRIIEVVDRQSPILVPEVSRATATDHRSSAINYRTTYYDRWLEISDLDDRGRRRESVALYVRREGTDRDREP